MRWIIGSDLHGSAEYTKLFLNAVESEKADRILLLGDILYHGPRNALPELYGPEQVFTMLNRYKDMILCVRGNCDAEVDQLLFSFPMMADYALMDAGSETFFLTHGHLWNEHKLPPVGIGTVLAHGHTHVPELKRLECGLSIFNPGSVSLPKGGSSCSFGYFDGESLRHYTI